MARTKRSIQILKGNWRYKRNAKADFQAAVVDSDPELMGFRPKVRPLQQAYDDKVPSAVLEVKYVSQTKNA